MGAALCDVTKGHTSLVYQEKAVADVQKHQIH